jgi:L-lactate permease
MELQQEMKVREEIHLRPRLRPLFNECWFTWILLVTIFIAESHSYAGRFSTVKQNWILTIDRTMEIQWNLKYLADEINAILYFFSFYFYRKNSINKATLITFIIFCLIDAVMYVHNFKTLFYGSVYVWLGGIWVIVFWSITHMKSIKRKKNGNVHER